MGGNITKVLQSGTGKLQPPCMINQLSCGGIHKQFPSALAVLNGFNLGWWPFCKIPTANTQTFESCNYHYVLEAYETLSYTKSKLRIHRGHELLPLMLP